MTSHETATAPSSIATKRPPRRARPIPPGVEYHRVLAGEKRQILKGILTIALLAVGLFTFSVVFSEIATVAERALGMSGYTPVRQAATMFGIGLMIPWSMFLQRWLYGIRGSSLSSVVSAFRMAVFGKALLYILPLWTINLVIVNLTMPYTSTSWPVMDLAVFFVVTILLTPLQAAGEEYGFRGLMFRVAASWGRGPVTALLLGIGVSGALFTVVHASTDPWLNIYYFVFATTLAVIAWRTGGLEIGIVIHAVNNTISFVLTLLLQMDLTAMLDRSTGAGSAIMLLPCALHIIVMTVVWIATGRSGPARTPKAPTGE